MQYGCIGERLTHSFSKIIHARLFDYDYKLVEIQKEKLADFMTKKDFRAINVTIPYKQDVIPFLDELSDTARTIGAVNTVVNRDGKLYGYNTDFGGMCALIEKNGIQIKGKKVLVLGSGGTSKTAVCVARHLGAAQVICVSRAEKDGCITYEQAYTSHSDAEVIINTTPCGMYPNIIGQPIDPSRFLRLQGLVDAIYNPLCSNLVVNARNCGAKAVGGLYMLVAQAALAAELFTDTEIPREKIDEVYGQILNSKQNIVLTGMPSSGKTTIGKMLAADLNMEFVDTDVEIERVSGKPVPEIFKSVGEKGFRDIEAEVIAQISTRTHTVIATGGGAVLRQENVTALKGNGRIFFIDRPPHLLIVTDDRPLSSNQADLTKRYNERYSIYCDTADEIIKNTTTAEAAVCALKEALSDENTCN